MTIARELLSLFSALAIAPLGPVLLLTYVNTPWQTVALGIAWALCWYIWIAARLRRH